MDQRRWRPNCIETAPNCPRCASPNTKFCYYNNYSLSQPRYFCKGCRRYWTKGGSLRNIPVGGGCRKSRRAKSSAMRARNESSVSAIFGSSPSGDTSSSSQSGSSGCEIDLAALFAKYLNQEPNLEKTDFRANQGEAIEEQNLAFVEDYNRRQEIEECEEMINEMSVETDPTLLSDREMTVWSGSAGDLPNLSWQPTVDLQEFDSFSTDDQLEIISADLAEDIDNWSCASFDLYSGMEVFSIP